MNISEEGIELIKKWEGLSLRAYTCPAGKLTIGYGHTRGVKKGATISLEGAEKLLREDLEYFEREVGRVVQVPLTQGQFDALVSFTFNLGVGAFIKSTLRQLLNIGDYIGAANEFPKWSKAKGRDGRLRTLDGLLSRRLDEQRVFNGALE